MCLSLSQGTKRVHSGILIAPLIAVLLSSIAIGLVQKTALGDGAMAASDWNRGNADGKAQADFDQQNGNLYNPCCSIHRSNDYCLGYGAGYFAEWAIDTVLMTQSQQQHKMTAPPPSTTSIPPRSTSSSPPSPRACPPIMHCE